MTQGITASKIDMFRLLKMRERTHLEMSDTSYPVTKSHIPEEWRPQLHRYESLKTSLIDANLCNERKTPTKNADGKPRKTPETENLDRKR